MKAKSTVSFTAWDEASYDEFAGGQKLTNAKVKTAYSGEIEGEGVLEYLMAYRSDEIVNYVGYERVTASVNGKSGSFVLQHTGVFEGGEAKSTIAVLENTATDALKGLSGKASYSAGENMKADFTLDYALD